MIRPTPTNLYGVALTLLASGVTTLDGLSTRIDPPPRRSDFAPGASGASMWRWHIMGYQTYMPERLAACSRVVGRLRELGLVLPAKGPPTVAVDVPDPLTPEWWRERCRALADVPEEGDYDPASGEAAPCDVLTAMVARIRAGAGTVEEAVGTSGHAWEVYERACEAEVLVSPRAVRVSDKGVQMVEAWRTT